MLIVAAVCCVLLVTTMGGNEVPWDSAVIKGLAAAAALLFAACVGQELRAREPILPPRLFVNRVFVTANLINLLTATGMLGGIVFMPLFLQLVYGLAPDDAGLMLIPLTATSVVAAITTGRLVAATGRYKIFPLLGVAVTGGGMLMLAATTETTPLWLTGVAMALAGSGIGLVMPVMMVVVQNAVEIRDLGTATSSISFFRSMGGSFGVALFGAVLIARLNSLIGALPDHAALGADPGIRLLHAGDAAQALAPAALRPAVAGAMASAFHSVFLVAAGIALLTLMSVLSLKEIPLKTTVGAAEAGRAAEDGGAAASLAD